MSTESNFCKSVDSKFNVIFTGEEIEIGKHKITNILYFHYKHSNFWFKISDGAEKDFLLFFLQTEV